MNLKPTICRVAVLMAAAMMALTVSAQKVKTGIEMLKANNFKQLEGKRVGLVTNPTGVDNFMKSDIDILHEAKNVKLVALFGPEHGVRGSVHAGDHVGNAADPTTGVPVYSLYGKSRIPSKEMLQGIDVLIYDIQDIGCRSFTYISTLGNIMKAAAENGIKVMVLDRPNPLGGLKVEGNLAEDDCLSFVSAFKIPYVYGLTPGEVALLLNGENMLGKKCDLEVVKMKGWKRKMTYDMRGDPSSAMLEVLDPEQNNTFSDHFLELPFDLSKVFWITPANVLGDIPRPLMDRMEIIDFTSYTEEEKVQIAKRYLVPKQVKENGLRPSQAKFSDAVLRRIIEGYTRESGVT